MCISVAVDFFQDTLGFGHPSEHSRPHNLHSEGEDCLMTLDHVMTRFVMWLELSRRVLKDFCNLRIVLRYGIMQYCIRSPFGGVKLAHRLKL